MERNEGEQSAYRIFEREFEALKKEKGLESATRALLVFSKALCWLRQWGHGNLTLSAVDHLFGLKLRGDTIMTIRKR